MNEGYDTITNWSRNSRTNPIKTRGMFRGTFTAEMYLKKADITDANIDQLDNIYKAQNNGELATAVFLHAVQDTEGTAATLTTTTTTMVTNIRKVTTDEDLVKFYVTADIIQPTTVAIT